MSFNILNMITLETMPREKRLQLKYFILGVILLQESFHDSNPRLKELAENFIEITKSLSKNF